MEKYEAYKKELRKIFIGCGVILAFFIILSFPIIRFGGNWIALFAPTRPMSIDRFSGWVLGSHILETEHGEIRLGRFSQVSVVNHRLATIDIENFQNGRSSHNLVIEGITIPANVAISFNSGRVSLVMMRGSRLARQEIMVSGVPINASRIDLNPRNSDADIMIGGGGIFPEQLSH